jgi:hypothetical protein
MPVFHSRHRVGPQKIAAFVAVGFVLGSVLGYIFMATVHAVGGSDVLRSMSRHVTLWSWTTSNYTCTIAHTFAKA